MSEATSALLVAPAFEPLIEQVRVHRVLNRTLDPRTVDLGVPNLKSGDVDKGGFVVDVNNGLVEVDARLSLATIAQLLLARGWLLPLLRPLPPIPLWRLVQQAPIVVDAVVQQGVLISVDGDVYATPKAPRHSAGPSVLSATTTKTPFSFLTRAKLRIAPIAHTPLRREDFANERDAAARVRALVDGGRVFGVDARGSSLAILGGEAGTQLPTPSSSCAPWTTSSARWTQAASIVAGDARAIEAALLRGHRVAAIPYLQRAAVLSRGAHKVAVVDVRGAAGALADALRSRP